MKLFSENIIYRLFESALEEINNFETTSESEEASILLLHELEYKLNILNRNPYAVPPKLLKNLAVRFLAKAESIWSNLQEKFIETFNDWMSKHPIQSSSEWADMIMDYYRENYGDGYKEDILKNGIQWGGEHGRQNYIDGPQIIKSVDPERLKASFREEMENSEGSLEAYANTDHMKAVLMDNGFTQEQLDEIEQEPNEFDVFMQHIKDNNLTFELIDKILENMDVEDYISGDPEFYSYLVTDDTIKKAIAELLYPQYMDMYGDRVERVIEDCVKASERLSETDKLVAGKYGKVLNAMMNANPQDTNELFGAVKQVYGLISQMAVAISLALNVNHVHGNIARDYGNMEVSTEFMDQLDQLDTSKWDKELGALSGRKLRR